MFNKNQSNNYNRKYGASPQFKYLIPETSSTDPIIVAWENYNPASQKYLPFNFTRIVNSSEVGCTFYPNQDDSRAIDVPAGTIQTIDRTTIPALNSFKIVPDSAVTIEASKIIVTNSNEGETTDSVVSRLHKRLVGGY